MPGVEEQDPKLKPDGTPVEEAPETPQEPVDAPEEQPGEVLPPEEETPVETPAAGEEPPAEEAGPTADELRAQLEAKDAEIAQLKADKPVAGEPQQRVSMGQVFLRDSKPALKAAFAAAKTPAEQYEVMFNTANQMVGVILQDAGVIGQDGKMRNLLADTQSLAAANIDLANEIEIRDLRSDPAFKASEAKVREQLKKMPWIERGDAGAVAKAFKAIGGKAQNGAAKTPAAAPAARTILKDLSAGGGASPKPATIRLSKEQEVDYQAIISDGVNLTRPEYYAKWKARADQAKAKKRPIPATYRG